MDSLLTDTLGMAPLEQVVHLLGIPLGWLAAGIPVVIAAVNTIKVAAAKWIKSEWLPVFGLLVSASYAYATLKPDWLNIIVGTFALWFSQWATWGLIKQGATKIGARNP